MKHLLLSLLAVPAFAADLSTQPGFVKAEFIYESAPFPSCHASTIVQTKSGLAAAWFGGTKEGAPDVGIWLSRQRDGKWSEPVEVATRVLDDGQHFACFNPVLFQPPNAPLLLFYKAGGTPAGWTGFLKTSTDEGATWSAPATIPDGFVGPVKNKPVLMPDGSILCGSSMESPEKPSKWRVQFERTADLGKTWTKTEFLNDGLEISAIQPSILFLGGDKLLSIGRTRQSRLFRIESDDAGKTWGRMTLTDLPNPNSGTDAVTLRDGRHLLVYNHTPKGRSPLNVAVSSDGQTWQAALVLENQPGEYSYPGVIQTSDGLVHIIYTWKRQRIKHVVVDPAKLVVAPIVDGAWPSTTAATPAGK
ncbi:MAG: sialidase family protein [Chthoniobacter sp.]|uniref:sialidase family protein n=1 Tax=Chthoniobacter sp. TaxID=2510640 RepID=UPI0032A2E706